MSENDRLLAGRYRLASRLGRGGMGVVWRAYDERLRREVAIKRLLLPDYLSAAETEEAKQRAMRESRIAARIQHPHVIAVYDVVEDDGTPCLVMEYLPSRSLSELVDQNGPLPISEVAEIGMQAARALASAHAVGVVHRDVKPGNVLIAEDGTVKIVDFGIARAVGDVTLTATGLISGTPAFLAPEVARGEAATPASDVFSLGATLYAAVEGAPPFGRNDNAIALLFQVAQGKIIPPRRAGVLTPILLRLLALRPEHRPGMWEASRALAAAASTTRRTVVTRRPRTSFGSGAAAGGGATADRPRAGAVASTGVGATTSDAPSNDGTQRLDTAQVQGAATVAAAAAVTGGTGRAGGVGSGGTGSGGTGSSGGGAPADARGDEGRSGDVTVQDTDAASDDTMVDAPGGGTTGEDAPKDDAARGASAAEGRTSERGADERGAGQGGTDQDGPDQDGADHDGADHDGSDQGATDQHGTDQDDAHQDDADQDDAGQDGAARNGADERGADEDGQAAAAGGADDASATPDDDTPSDAPAGDPATAKADDAKAGDAKAGDAKAGDAIATSRVPVEVPTQPVRRDPAVVSSAAATVAAVPASAAAATDAAPTTSLPTKPGPSEPGPTEPPPIEPAATAPTSVATVAVTNGRSQGGAFVLGTPEAPSGTSAGRPRSWVVVAVIAALAVVAVVLVLLLRPDATTIDPDQAPATGQPATPHGDDGGGAGAEEPKSRSSTEPRPDDSSTPQAPAASASPSTTPYPPGQTHETPAGTPSPPAPPPSTPADDDADDDASEPTTTPGQAISDYYALMPGNTQAGWSRLSARYQQRSAGGFDSYQAFWSQFSDVQVSDVRQTSDTTVLARVVYRFKDGRVSNERHRYTLVWQDGHWLIDDSAVL